MDESIRTQALQVVTSVASDRVSEQVVNVLKSCTEDTNPEVMPLTSSFVVLLVMFPSGQAQRDPSLSGSGKKRFKLRESFRDEAFPGLIQVCSLSRRCR